MGYAEDYANWLPVARSKKAKYLLFVCDDFDYTHYPVYVQTDADLQTQQQKYFSNMQRIIEIIDVATGREIRSPWCESNPTDSSSSPKSPNHGIHSKSYHQSRGISKTSRRNRKQKR